MADEIDCEGICVESIVIDVDQFALVYDELNKKVRADLQDDYDCKKINGTTFADTWAKMMGPAVGQILNAVVSLQNKETLHDRLVKEEQIKASGTKSTNETCIATSTCALNNAKTKAEDIKNGDKSDGSSLYGYNKKMVQEQTSLYKRQKEGFDDNQRQKYLDSLTGPFSILFQDLDDTSEQRPVCLQDSGIQEAANLIKSGM